MRRAQLLLVAGLLAVSGCATLPEHGPIESGKVTGAAVENDALNIDPRGPQPGDSPADIVNGFLEAMQQTPIRTTVAREFLSRASAEIWQPGDETITYDDVTQLPPPRGSKQVTVTLTNAAHLDNRGAWEGTIPDTDNDVDGYDVSFEVVHENGQWRIDDPPNALIVPESWFEERFQQVSLYFFDPTGQILVPDPVFVPSGQQLATSLVGGLLAGPSPELADHSLTQLPAHLKPAISVPVSSSGLADVQLTGDNDAAIVPTGVAAQQMVAQLTWTLRQDQEDPAIEKVRVTIDGQPLRVSGETEFPIETGEKYAPYGSGASTLLYGLVDGRMVSGSAQNLNAVPGPLGQDPQELRDIVPDILADRAAGVSTDGHSMLLGSVRVGAAPPTTVLSGAQDLLKPAWDFSGRVWTIDRTSTGGAVLYYVEADGTDRKPTELTVPGITGLDVKAFLISRDGSRLVAVVRHGRDDDQIVVSRILTAVDGHVVQALQAVPVTEQDVTAGQPIRDIAWQSPTSIAVLHPVGQSLFQVRSATVDGAPSGLNSLSTTINGDFTGLAGTPSPQQSVYAVGRGRLIALSGRRAGSLEIDPAVVGLTYSG